MDAKRGDVGLRIEQDEHGDMAKTKEQSARRVADPFPTVVPGKICIASPRQWQQQATRAEDA